LAFSLLAFQIFGIADIIARYIAVRDLFNLTKAVVGSELMTATALFTVTRLEGIPRSVPTIHALILWAGLIAFRALGNLAHRPGRHADHLRTPTCENVILIGLNEWSVLLMKYLQAHAREPQRFIALLDENPRWTGRSVNGVRVFGPPAHLEAIIEEFATHGLDMDWVVVGEELSNEAAAEVRAICAQRHLDLFFIPNFGALCSARRRLSAKKCPDRLQSSGFPSDIRLSPYFLFKRMMDVIIASILIVTLLPLSVVIAFIVLVDVGWPLLFWQQRAGQGGRELQIYKLRTLRPPFDSRGQRIPEEQRLSCAGRLLRQTRFDELPQLLNVLVGDMSLIGPRPLLPRDQPPHASLRLTVRPGITGWAQVNGGTLLSPMEKDALDVWYIRKASIWLDLRVIGMTFLSLVRSDRRSEEALASAIQSHCQERGSSESLSSWFVPANATHTDKAGQQAD
jgi:lipopolysaccharide/colanic/teichoic acid biosynthesis glycosyltransferase